MGTQTSQGRGRGRQGAEDTLGQAPHSATGTQRVLAWMGGCPKTLQPLHQPHEVLGNCFHSAFVETKAIGGGLLRAWKGVRGRAGIHTQVLCGYGAAPQRCHWGGEA